MALLEIRSVGKRFGGLAALSDVDIDVEQGEIRGIIGPNGAGKTTLFNVIAGYYPPTTGTVQFEGKTTNGLKPYDVCRRGIARTFQLTRPFLFLSVLDNVLTAAFLHTALKGRAKEIAMERLEWVGLSAKANMLARNLTAGEQKKLGLATALATNPRLLLADEVMAGLNPRETQELAERLRTLPSHGVTVIAVEHKIKALLSICDRVAVLDFGRKIADGTPKEIVVDKAVIGAYLGKDYAAGSQ